MGDVRERATEGKPSGFGIRFRIPFLMAFLGRLIGATGPVSSRVQHVDLGQLPTVGGQSEEEGQHRSGTDGSFGG